MTFPHLADMTSGNSRLEPPSTHWAYNDLGINLYHRTSSTFTEVKLQ